jgi:hypothetical protein
MNKVVVVLLTIVFLQNSVYAADKIRIAYGIRGSSFITLPLAQKKGFFARSHELFTYPVGGLI